MNSNLAIKSEPITNRHRLELVMKQQWLTLNAAAERDDCPVTSQTLRVMINRGDVSEDCYQERPYGSRTIYYILADCIPNLDYKSQGRKQGWNKEK